MAKINKLQKSGVTIYPATIPQAVIDSETGKTQKEVNDELIELESKANIVQEQVTGIPITTTWEYGKAINANSLSINPTQGYRLSSAIPVQAGDKFYINSAGSYISYITSCQQDGTLIESLLRSPLSGTSTDNVLHSIEIESDGYVRVCYKYSIEGAFASKDNSIINDILELKEQVNGLPEQVDGVQEQANIVQEQVNGVQEQANIVQEQVTGIPITTTWEYGKAINANSLSINPTQGYRLSSAIPVQAGDKFYINSAGSYISYITSCQQDGTLIESLLFSTSSGTSTSNALYNLKIESDGYVRICYKYSIEGAFAAKDNSIINDIAELKEQVNGLPEQVDGVQEQANIVQEQVNGIPITTTWEDGKAINAGNLSIQPIQGYRLSSVIPVQAGDKFYINSAGGGISYITSCQQDGTLIESLLSSAYPGSSTDNVLRTIEIESDGYVRICYKYSIEGAFATKDDCIINDIAELREQVNTPHHIRFFYFGNSYGCDSVSYVPFILKEMGITSDIYLYVRDACSLRDIYNRWECDAPRDKETDGIHAGSYQRFISHIDTRSMTRWQTITRESMKATLERGGWDFVTLQQWSAYSIDPTTYSPWLDLDISLINESLDKETALAWTQVWTRSTHDNQPASLSTFRDTVYAKYPFEMFIPCGTAIFNARANPSIAQIGGGTNLWASDGVHLQDGLGCYIAALTIVESILRKFFPNKSIMFDSTEIGDNILNWNIPEFHGPVVGMTKENRLAAQKAVIMACNHMFEINAAKYDPFIEYETLSDFPETGTSGILYKATDNGYTYTWDGSQYVYNEALPYSE